MQKIVVDMQNYLFADSVAAAFKNSDYDIDVVRAKSPNEHSRTMSVVQTVCSDYGSDRLYPLAALREAEAS